MPRLRLIFALSVLVALALPAGGTPALRKTFFSLTTDPVRTGKGYRLSLRAWQQDLGGSPSRSWLEVTLAKRRGAATQQHVWNVLLSSPGLRCSSLARCTLESSLGGYGRLRFTFTAAGATGSSACGSGVPQRVRSGSARGLLLFRSRSGYFKVIRHRSFRAHVRSGVLDSVECGRAPDPSQCGRTTLAVPGPTHGTDHNFVLTVPKRATAATASFDYVALGSTATHRIFVSPLPRSSWHFSRDASSATLDGSGIPFLAGKLRFKSVSRETRQHSCGRMLTASGLTEGSLVVHLDGHRLFRLRGTGQLIRYS